MFSYATPSTKLEPLLRAACRRALGLGLSFMDQIHAYRSVLALAREVRVRCAGALFDGGNQASFALLAEVCERACVLGLDPELPFADAILVQRLVVRLSRAARQAGDAGAAAHPISKQHPMHREKPVQHGAAETAEPPVHPISKQHPVHREKPAQHGAAKTAEPAVHPISKQHPIQREKPLQHDAVVRGELAEEDDYRLSAWRNDHTTERDRRAYEKLRTVIDERVISKVKAMNQRDREEREAAARAAVG